MKTLLASRTKRMQRKPRKEMLAGRPNRVSMKRCPAMAIRRQLMRKGGFCSASLSLSIYSIKLCWAHY
ncbi:hypothetical protein BC830DRAFT_1113383 [Chytriomyces sp. MP71]|nr:hypothetical protein BC830DRAFT_1113383 [Chytriomyces sp. MP71]